uniref:SH3 domain-containing protein n=1 Tax=Macrostomum lignano TaxID=282301 RepID=A0A1I8FA85_9PLAT
MTIGQHEFEPETRPYYGSLGRSPQPHQPHHRQQRQSRIGDKMRHSLDSEQRQQRQPAAAEQQRGRPITDAQAEPSIVYGSHQQPLAAWRNGGGHGGLQLDGRVSHQDTAGAGYFVDRKLSNGNIRQAAAAQLSYSASAQPQRDTSGQRAMEPPIQQQPFATAGRLPFAPKQAADIRSGDLVKFTRYGGRISKAWCTLSAACLAGQIIMSALSWTRRRASTTGCYDGQAAISVPRKGVFVAFNKLIMCYQAA